MAGFDWPALIQAGLGRLRLRPGEFWGLTPAELVMMLGEPQAVRPMDRAGLEALRAAWPDKMERKPDGGDGRVGRA